MVAALSPGQRTNGGERVSITAIDVWHGLKLAAEAVTAGCTIASAAYWLRSAQARVPTTATEDQVDAGGWAPATISGVDGLGDFDRFASIDEQSRLSAIAARWAAGASIGVALVTFIDIFVQ